MSQIQNEIDGLVYNLYGMSKDDIHIIGGFFKDKYVFRQQKVTCFLIWDAHLYYFIALKATDGCLNLHRGQIRTNLIL